MKFRVFLVAAEAFVSSLGFGSPASALSICNFDYGLQLPIVAQTTDFTCGVACFDSVLRYWFGTSPREIPLAYSLGTMLRGRTDGYAIVLAANYFGLHAREQFGGTIAQVRYYLSQKETVYVGWNLDGSGHYSLVQAIGPTMISLMDPWHARTRPNEYNTMPISRFVPIWFGHVIRISPKPLPF